VFFAEGPTQDSLINELQFNEWAMHDPYQIAEDFIIAREGGSEYFDEGTGMHTAYADSLANNRPTLAMGLTGNIGDSPIKVGQQYKHEDVLPVFKDRVRTDYDMLNRELDGDFTSFFNPNQRAAVLSLLYNVGWDNLTKSDAFKALKGGDLDTFKEEAFGPGGFVNTYDEQGNKHYVEGLANRRQLERELFDKPLN